MTPSIFHPTRKGGDCMAIAFSCPSCKAHVQVTDDLAGQTGQCPLCERLIVIPSSAKPMPTLLDADGNPVPILMPVQAPPREEAKAKSPRYDEPRRSRRATPVEKKPSGPMWPWALGVLACIAVVGLLFSSFIVLCAYRPVEPRSNVQVLVTNRNKPRDSMIGKLEGNRATLQDGVFQVRGVLTRNDPVGLNGRYKHYNIELRGNVHYVLEVDSDHFPAAIRLEDRRGNILLENRNAVNGGVTIAHLPPFTDEFTVIATTVNPGFGDFTVTIREAHRMKPALR